MSVPGNLAVVAALWLLAGCGVHDGSERTQVHSGIAGWVQLGPQCPVVSEDHPCPDKPAAGSTVTVFKGLPADVVAGGADVVARTTIHADGSYRLAVAPGTYVVTADAGMSCEVVDARVTGGEYATVDIPCDTGIR